MSFSFGYHVSEPKAYPTYSLDEWLATDRAIRAELDACGVLGDYNKGDWSLQDKPFLYLGVWKSLLAEFPFNVVYPWGDHITGWSNFQSHVGETVKRLGIQPVLITAKRHVDHIRIHSRNEEELALLMLSV